MMNTRSLRIRSRPPVRQRGKTSSPPRLDPAAQLRELRGSHASNSFYRLSPIALLKSAGHEHAAKRVAATLRLRALEKSSHKWPAADSAPLGGLADRFTLGDLSRGIARTLFSVGKRGLACDVQCVGTRRFSSSNQFCTTVIAALVRSGELLCFNIRNRFPSGDMS